MKLITSQYPGKCVSCGASYRRGDVIGFDGKPHCRTCAKSGEDLERAEEATRPAVRATLVGNEVLFVTVERLGPGRWDVFRLAIAGARWERGTSNNYLSPAKAGLAIAKLTEQKILVDIGPGVREAVEGAASNPAASADLGVTLDGGDVVVVARERLGDRFDAFRSAIGDFAAFEDGKNYVDIFSAGEAIESLSEAGFTLDVSEEVRLALAAMSVKPNEVREAEEMRQRIAKLPLRPYQVEGVEWMVGRDGAGGIVADDMGLGKTLQLLAALPNKGRAVVVSPASVKAVWARNEGPKWRPDLRFTQLFAGGEPFRWPEAGEVMVLNYHILPQPVEQKKGSRRSPLLPGHLASSAPEGVVLIADEADSNALGNPESQKHRAFRALAKALRVRKGRVFIVSGTPLKNKPPELWAMLQTAGLERQAFGNWRSFFRLAGGRKEAVVSKSGRPVTGPSGGPLYRTVWDNALIESEGVADALRKVMLRRRKADVWKDMPAKSFVVRSAEVDQETARLADEAMAGMSRKFGSIEKAVKALGESSLSFTEISAARAALASAKLPTLLEIVEEYETAEEPLVVFSAFREPVDLLGKRKGWAAISGELTGKRGADQRAKAVEDFQAGRLKGIALTIKAGGAGITLTRATSLVRVDKEWTPSANAQAEDRIHRIGQEHPVTIIDIVADHPLDERIHEILIAKTEMFDRIVNAATVQHAPVVESLEHRVPDWEEIDRRVVDEAPVAFDWEKLDEALHGLLDDAEKARRDLAEAKTQGERDLAERRKRNAFDGMRGVLRQAAARRNKELEELEEAPRRGPSNEVEFWAAQGATALTLVDGDFAQVRNEMGWSQADAGIGHAVAGMVAAGMGLTDGEWRMLVRMVHKYQGQIGERPDTDEIAARRAARREALARRQTTRAPHPGVLEAIGLVEALDLEF